MECFRVDESGYTGFDLPNAEQPFQGAAAIAITDDEAARLVKEHFQNLQATELKYGALARKTANHPRLLSLIKTILTDYKCVTYVCDKRYLLLLMFLDYAVEPFYYERGLDFYKDGQNYALASLLSSAGSTLLGQVEFNAMLSGLGLGLGLGPHCVPLWGARTNMLAKYQWPMCSYVLECHVKKKSYWTSRPSTSENVQQYPNPSLFCLQFRLRMWVRFLKCLCGCEKSNQWLAKRQISFQSRLWPW